MLGEALALRQEEGAHEVEDIVGHLGIQDLMLIFFRFCPLQNLRTALRVSVLCSPGLACPWQSNLPRLEA